MIERDFDKMVQYQRRAKPIYLGSGRRTTNNDPSTNNRKMANSNPGAAGREM
ncbi:hypothetical protein [Ornithinibacillus scapharcae]|uniref:hypothetical protein n=1 Tax=Ornithinibacillus scapharcae TaxID=1147159 RepID=UPI000225BD29|nr:hypothetical protein [Ornithinibacillus scapharcae]